MPTPTITVSVVVDFFQGLRVGSPVAVPAGTTSIKFTGLMSSADALNTALTGRYELQFSSDPQSRDDSFATSDTQNWAGAIGRDGVTANFPNGGGTLQDDGQPIPLFARVKITNDQLMSSGASITIS